MKQTEKIKVVNGEKAAQILGCGQTAFYNLYYKKLKPHSTFGLDKRKRLYFLDKVNEMKEDINASISNYEIIE